VPTGNMKKSGTFGKGKPSKDYSYKERMFLFFDTNCMHSAGNQNSKWPHQNK
jgi:hypothetical protein